MWGLVYINNNLVLLKTIQKKKNYSKQLLGNHNYSNKVLVLTMCQVIPWALYMCYPTWSILTTTLGIDISVIFLLHKKKLRCVMKK